MFYYLAIGTNIYPEKNSVAIIRKLIEEFGILYVFPFIRTQPENLHTRNYFLNSVVIITSELDERDIKARLNAIESMLGRDRNDPDSSNKDRPADIDILETCETLSADTHPQTKESFIQDVLDYSGRISDLSDYGLPFFNRATIVNLDAASGDIIIVDNTLDGFIRQQESTFITGVD